jgi:hypothetical protein
LLLWLIEADVFQMPQLHKHLTLVAITMTTFTINRLSFDKAIVDTGLLVLTLKDNQLFLHYKDQEIDAQSNDLFTIVALEKLRLQLESKGFLINCNGCREDTTYRAAGVQVGLMTYIMEKGHQAKQTINIFEPTNELSKICTVDEHKKKYKEWTQSL